MKKSPKAHKFSKGHKPWDTDKKRPEISGKNHPNWKGGIVKVNGYIKILKPNHPFCDCSGYMKRSRLLMEKHLGRFLDSKEIVHHINEIKDDDQLKNLMVFTSKSAHQRFHKSSNNVKPKEIIFDGRYYESKRTVKVDKPD